MFTVKNFYYFVIKIFGVTISISGYHCHLSLSIIYYSTLYAHELNKLVHA